jgi:hypothetical protein
MKTIQEWQYFIKEWGLMKGWNEKLDTVEKIGTKLLLINTEISEAFEELRTSTYLETHKLNMAYFNKTPKPEGFSVELADTAIRLLHLCALLNIDLDKAVEIKMQYNMLREVRHGGKLA